MSARYDVQPIGDWGNQAACLYADPELFFPGRGESVKEAKAICRGCPVRIDCLEHAIRNGERFGIWGGMSERERRNLRRGRPNTSTPRGTAA